MTTAVIITICALLLLAYVFDLSARLTRVPSVILLLLLGWAVSRGVAQLGIAVPDLNALLPGVGTIGLILIVLEGSLELELDRSKLPLVKKSVINALLPMLALAFIFAFIFQHLGRVPYQTALANAIPLCVISSAIAIPSVRNLGATHKEFIIYESSLSDIFGVLLFNFVALNSTISVLSFAGFAGQLLLIIAISFVAVLGLSFLLSRLTHHVTFTPILLMVILIYAVSKLLHLPGLVFILVFGLFLGNTHRLKHFNWIEKLRPDKLDIEVKKFKEITIEATFVIRALFFILFGFLLQTSEILNPDTLPLAAALVGSILIVRGVALKASSLPLLPLLFVAPRGLITILLFLGIAPGQNIPIVNKSLIVQTILFTVLVMMVGVMAAGKKEDA